LTYAFIPLRRKGSKATTKVIFTYNNYLSCEECGAELLRANQKQHLDSAGYMHSYCQKCYEEKRGKK
jgi:hypothetical protein